MQLSKPVFVFRRLWTELVEVLTSYHSYKVDSVWYGGMIWIYRTKTRTYGSCQTFDNVCVYSPYAFFLSLKIFLWKLVLTWKPKGTSCLLDYNLCFSEDQSILLNQWSTWYLVISTSENTVDSCNQEVALKQTASHSCNTNYTVFTLFLFNLQVLEHSCHTTLCSN